MKLFDLISSMVSRKWPASKDLWEAGGIQWLVTMSLACQITLAILGSRRRYKTSAILRYVIHTAYLLSSNFATVTLGKLTVVQIDNPHRPDYITELTVLLAPLLLMELGNPDSITAASVEDNRLSIRQMLNLSVRAVFVVCILIRCWDSSSPIPLLYIPLSVAGIIQSALTIWALTYVYWERSSISVKDIFDEKAVANFFNSPERLRWTNEQRIILKAYYRFCWLKPHIINWPYHPELLSESHLIVDHDLAFITAEVELGFMYDVLYTKHPVLYKPCSLVCRFVSFFCLVSALCGFAVIFKSAFFIDMYITYTYALLIGVTAIEGWQIVLQPFSPWAIVAMTHHQSNCLVSTRLLRSLAERYMKRKKWSNSIGQLNLLDRCLYDEWPWWSPGSIFRHFGKIEATWRRCQLRPPLNIPSCLKELLVANIEKFDTIRRQKPFMERGNWTLQAHELSGNALEVLKKNILTTFDKSIIIWHMATIICLCSVSDDSQYCEGSKLLSDYMIYLLARRPYMLSLTTANIALKHACKNLKPFILRKDRNANLGTLLSEETGQWDELRHAQELAATLKDQDKKWQIISSIWVEMLCYAAYDCQVYYHEKLLRRGGELITHVWLLLMHGTDKYPHFPKIKPTKETKG